MRRGDEGRLWRSVKIDARRFNCEVARIAILGMSKQYLYRSAVKAEGAVWVTVVVDIDLENART